MTYSGAFSLYRSKIFRVSIFGLFDLLTLNMTFAFRTYMTCTKFEVDQPIRSLLIMFLLLIRYVTL